MGIGVGEKLPMQKTSNIINIGQKKVFVASRPEYFFDQFKLADKEAKALGFAGGVPADYPTLHIFIMMKTRSGFFFSRNLLVSESNEMKFKKRHDVVDTGAITIVPWENFRKMLDQFQIDVSDMAKYAYLIDPVIEEKSTLKDGRRVIIPNLKSDSTRPFLNVAITGAHHDSAIDGVKGVFNTYGIPIIVPQDVLNALLPKQIGEIYAEGIRPVARAGEYLGEIGVHFLTNKVFAAYLPHNVNNCFQVLVEVIENKQ